MNIRKVTWNSNLGIAVIQKHLYILYRASFYLDTCLVWPPAGVARNFTSLHVPMSITLTVMCQGMGALSTLSQRAVPRDWSNIWWLACGKCWSLPIAWWRIPWPLLVSAWQPSLFRRQGDWVYMRHWQHLDQWTTCCPQLQELGHWLIRGKLWTVG